MAFVYREEWHCMDYGTQPVDYGTQRVEYGSQRMDYEDTDVGR